LNELEPLPISQSEAESEADSQVDSEEAAATTVTAADAAAEAGEVEAAEAVAATTVAAEATTVAEAVAAAANAAEVEAAAEATTVATAVAEMEAEAAVEAEAEAAPDMPVGSWADNNNDKSNGEVLPRETMHGGEVLDEIAENTSRGGTTDGRAPTLALVSDVDDGRLEALKAELQDIRAAYEEQGYALRDEARARAAAEAAAGDEARARAAAEAAVQMLELEKEEDDAELESVMNAMERAVQEAEAGAFTRPLLSSS
jgi:hypothetical protein